MALGKILVDVIEDGDENQHTVSELQSVYEVIARANNTTSDDVALLETTTYTGQHYFYLSGNVWYVEDGVTGSCTSIGTDDNGIRTLTVAGDSVTARLNINSGQQLDTIATAAILKTTEPVYNGQPINLQRYATSNLGGGIFYGKVDDVHYPTDGSTNAADDDTVPVDTTVIRYSDVDYYLAKPVETAGTLAIIAATDYGLLSCTVGGIQYNGVSEENEGYFFVTDNGRRWIREPTNYLNLGWFGLQFGGSLDDAIDSAVSVSQAFNILSIKVPSPIPATSPYTIDSAHVYDLYYGDTGFAIEAETIYGGRGIYLEQTVEGIAFWIQRSSTNNGIESVFNGVAFRGFYFSFTGSDDSSARAIRCSDSWGYVVDNCNFYNYTTLHPVHAYNYNYWTEHFSMYHCMSRGCIGLLKLSQSGTGDATESFFGLTLKDCWSSFTVGNGHGIELGDGTNEVNAYGADIEFGGWFESGGGHRFIYAYDYASLTGKIKLTPDGLAGSSGSDLFWMYKTGLNGHIDTDCHVTSRPVYSMSSLSDGDSIDLPYIIAGSPTGYQNMSGTASAPVIARGARIRLYESGSSADRVITIRNLHINTRWRITMWVANVPAGSYIVQVKTSNYTPYVTMENWDSTNSQPYSNILTNYYVRSYEGSYPDNWGGDYLANGQGKVDLVMNSATSGTANKVIVDLEMIG